ncbi:MAG: segregation/condensation protein A [Hyphomicrobiaceae bacterium]|nr:segregation/condensation protein A [Hyphomicrobiaceae bacterium]
MTATGQQDWFDAAEDERSDDEVLRVDVDGFEGPLDLLLDLARRQKVDLAQVSILALAEQYLAFIETVRRKRIEIAADYLVMAAWLAYLKSRLMVPQASDDEEPSGEMMAALLQFRLKRLEAMRHAAARLTARPQLGTDIFARGAPEPVLVERANRWQVTLYDLLRAYGDIRERTIPVDYFPAKRTVWGLQDAREILERLVGHTGEWMALDSYLADYLVSPEERATVLASSFSATLELVREGHLEVRQSLTFGPLMLRRRTDRNN